MKVVRNSVLVIISLFICVQLLPVTEAGVKSNHFQRKEDGQPLVIAHGGAKLLWPENTMVAFQESVRLGVDVLEMDVCLTRDDVLVPHHDSTIDRTSDGHGYVKDMTFSELQQFNFGDDFVDLSGNKPYKNEPVRISKLEDVFRAFPNMTYVVEIKDKGELGKRAADQLLSLLSTYELFDRTIVGSFHDEILTYVRSKHPRVLTSTAEKETTSLVLSTYTGTSSIFSNRAPVAVQIPTSASGIPLDTGMLIGRLQKRNIAVHYWTVNDLNTMRQLIALGVDGIITDRPDLLIQLLNHN
ncbi:MAG: glycerophosphodiester phosphodiesterase [Bacilli bacterium]